VEEHKNIENFQVSRHNVWIHEKRDPKNNRLQMKYHITGEEVQWVMKDWPDEWKVTKKKGQKGKNPIEDGTSHKSNSLVDNTRKVVECAKDTGGSVIVKKPRQKTTQNPKM
jgi:hypothetical protein